jgi:hypothetical protein
VIDTICRAAYHVERGSIGLTESQKNLFRQHRRAIASLTTPRISRKRKRAVIEGQKAGFPFLPILIATANDAVGNALFDDGDEESDYELLGAAADTSTEYEKCDDQ